MVGGVFKRNSWKINLIRNKCYCGFSPFQEEITLRKVLLICNIVTRTFDIQNICHSFGQCPLSLALVNISKPSDLMPIFETLCFFMSSGLSKITLAENWLIIVSSSL